MSSDARSGEQLIEALVRWEDSGAVWRVLERQPERVTVAFLRCDGGEEVDRLTSGDPAWLAYLADRDGNED